MPHKGHNMCIFDFQMQLVMRKMGDNLQKVLHVIQSMP